MSIFAHCIHCWLSISIFLFSIQGHWSSRLYYIPYIALVLYTNVVVVNDDSELACRLRVRLSVRLPECLSVCPPVRLSARHSSERKPVEASEEEEVVEEGELVLGITNVHCDHSPFLSFPSVRQ